MKTPFLRATLAISVLATQCLFAYEPEKNFWAERKAAFQKMGRRHNRSDPGLLAISTIQGAGCTESPNDLLVKFPPATPIYFGAPHDIARPSLKGEVPRTGFPLSKADSAQLPPSILAYGSIREIHLAKNPGAPLIIHIQDAHDSEEAQKNMAALIQILQEERGIHLIGLEGAQGAFALEPYRAYPEKKISRSLAAYFLKRGDIGGPEYVGLTAPKAPLLWGVEDRAGYENNVRALKKSLQNIPALNRRLAQLNASADSLKEKFYSPALHEFDRHSEAYKNQKEGLSAYVKFLGAVPNQGDPVLPNLRLLLQALGLEETLDFKRVENERLDLVEKLAREIPQPQLTILVQQSLQCRLGQISYTDYYRFLQNLCADTKIPLNTYVQLNSYIRYVILTEQIDRNALLDELRRQEETTQDRLAKTPEQKRLVTASRHLLLLEKLAGLSMTPTDWQTYLSQRQDILRVEESLPPLTRSTEKTGEFSRELKPFEDFCLCALARNQSLVSNLLIKLKTEKVPSALLVAGGFHTEGLTRILRNENVSYVLVAPKITEVPKDSHYLDVFSRDPLPLEKLFAGETISLTLPRQLAQTVFDFAHAPERERAMAATWELGHPAAEAFQKLQEVVERKGTRDDWENLKTHLIDQAQELGRNFTHSVDSLEIRFKNTWDKRGFYFIVDGQLTKGEKTVPLRVVVTSKEKADTALRQLKKSTRGDLLEKIELDSGLVLFLFENAQGRWRTNPKKQSQEFARTWITQKRLSHFLARLLEENLVLMLPAYGIIFLGFHFLSPPFWPVAFFLALVWVFGYSRVLAFVSHRKVYVAPTLRIRRAKAWEKILIWKFFIVIGILSLLPLFPFLHAAPLGIISWTDLMGKIVLGFGAGVLAHIGLDLFQWFHPFRWLPKFLFLSPIGVTGLPPGNYLEKILRDQDLLNVSVLRNWG